jgi:hypothetical protein
MLILTSGLSFFGLSFNYRKYMLDEFYVLSKFLHMSYKDFNEIPTYMRKYLVDKIIEENTPKN